MIVRLRTVAVACACRNDVDRQIPAHPVQGAIGASPQRRAQCAPFLLGIVWVGCARLVTPILRREEPMKRRAFMAGTTALAGLSALPWRVAIAGHKGESGTPKPGGTLRVAFASDIHAGRFQL